MTINQLYVLSNTPIDNVTYYNFALSDEDNTVSFYRNKISLTNSLFKVNMGSSDSIGITKILADNDTDKL